MDEDTFLWGSAIVGAVALYAAIATREPLRNDWPARKVRVRDGSKTPQGPFRALENTGEREVGAGPPWPVHLTALFGHGISALSFFVTVAIWTMLWTGVVVGNRHDSNSVWLVMLASAAGSFVLGRHQWHGSTVSLATDYVGARAHTGRAVLGRIVADAAPLIVIVASTPNTGDLNAFALGCSIPTVHALLALLAVLVSKRHYEAAAIALQERNSAKSGVVAR
jgi:hypothetical protein